MKSSIYYSRALIVVILVVCAMTFSCSSALVLRKTTTTFTQGNGGQSISEVTMIEEIQQSDNSEMLPQMISNNAALIGSEMDYASELAALLLSTVQGVLVEDSYLQNQGQVIQQNQFLGEFPAGVLYETTTMMPIEVEVEPEEVIIVRPAGIINSQESSFIENASFVPASAESDPVELAKWISDDNDDDGDTIDALNNDNPAETKKSRRQRKRITKTESNPQIELVSESEKENQNSRQSTSDEIRTEQSNITNEKKTNNDNNNEQPKQVKEKVKMRLPMLGLGPQLSMKARKNSNATENNSSSESNNDDDVSSLSIGQSEYMFGIGFLLFVIGLVMAALLYRVKARRSNQKSNQSKSTILEPSSDPFVPLLSTPSKASLKTNLNHNSNDIERKAKVF